MLFFAGETSRALALSLAYAAENVTSTCRQVHGRGSTHKRIYKAPARRILAPFFFKRFVSLQLRLVLVAIHLNSNCQTVTTTIVITSN